MVEVYQEGRKKDHLPRGDASLLLAGLLVLSQKAVDVLGPFLLHFVFKDTRTVRIRIYVNDEAKRPLEADIATHGLTGFELTPLGAH